MKIESFFYGILVIALLLVENAHAQPGNDRTPVVSPEISNNRSVTFRIFAPNADEVRFVSNDMPGHGDSGSLMNRNAEGEWETTIESVSPGAYRYNFNVDGLTVIDPVNPITVQANARPWSFVTVSGNPLMDTRNVPHGVVSEVNYYSESLGRFRRMHVYTPPGYESEGNEEYPVYYLLHGGGDNDDLWSTLGRAGFILDNLIAEGKALPMIVVMPDGHASTNRGPDRYRNDSFVMDFNEDIKPFIEENYRAKTDRVNTAISGLSMGGAQTLNIGIPNLDEFGYIGVFSSGIFGINDSDAESPTYEEINADVLNDDSLKDGLELFWFATGKDDFLLETSRATVDTFKEYGFDVVYEETEGGHTWSVWREYLIEFAPMLFR